jgi:NADH dehydrogenase
MKTLIIGGGYAGVATALRLSRRARKLGRHANITLVNESDQFVERIRLHQAAAGQHLRRRALRPLLARAGVKLLVGRADWIDPERKKIGAGGGVLKWDRLVLATGGSAPARPFAWTLNPTMIRGLAARLSGLALPGGSVVVVGGGLTGIETATEIAERWPTLNVTLVTQAAVAEDWSPAARQHILAALHRLNVAVVEGEQVIDVSATQVRTRNGTLPSDLCIWTAGARFGALARAASLATDRNGQAIVDPFLRSVSHPHIYAAGDGALADDMPRDLLPPGCKSALPMGAHVGDNLARELVDRPDLRALRFSIPFYCVSLGRRDGLVQWPSAAGDLTGRVLKGRPAAWFKEAVCRATWVSLAGEACGLPTLQWKQGPPAFAPAGAC